MKTFEDDTSDLSPNASSVQSVDKVAEHLDAEHLDAEHLDTEQLDESPGDSFTPSGLDDHALKEVLEELERSGRWYSKLSSRLDACQCRRASFNAGSLARGIGLLRENLGRDRRELHRVGVALHELLVDSEQLAPSPGDTPILSGLDDPALKEVLKELERSGQMVRRVVFPPRCLPGRSRSGKGLVLG